MELRRANNVDDEEKSMHLGRDLELIWRQLKWNQNKEMEEMTNENLKIKYFHFA